MSPMRRFLSPIALLAVFAASLIGFDVWASHRVLFYPCWFLLSGSLFDPDRPIITGGALDQPSLHKYLFMFVLEAVWFGLFVLAARCLTRTREQWSLRVFRIGAVAVFIPPLVLLTCTLYDVVRYIDAMGVTGPRVLAAVMCVAGYLVVIGFLLWAARIDWCGIREGAGDQRQ